MRKRGLSSVILPERATAAVFSDARRFLEPRAREWYAKHSIPYKRTYLLYGPPGCGKSYLAARLATGLSRRPRGSCTTTSTRTRA